MQKQNSQLEQLENTVSLKHREKRMKNFKEFVKPLFSSALFFAILKFPLLVMAKENGNPPTNENQGEDSNSSTLFFLANFCTAAYHLWKKAGLPGVSFSDFMKKCVDAIFEVMSSVETCPAPPPAGGPKPGGPPPAFLNSLKSSPYVMGGSILLIALLFVYVSVNSKEKEEKKE